MQLATVDHRNLDVDVGYFSENHIVSTAENLAVFFWRALKRYPVLAPLLYEVRIDETEKNVAIYRGDDDSDDDAAQLCGLGVFNAPR